MSNRTNRRAFIKTTAIIGAGVWTSQGLRAEKESNSPNQKLQIGCIGAGGKGRSDTNYASRNGKIYALCDIDRKLLAASAKGYKTENTYTDYRELFDKVGDKLDAVTVSTPDHMHGVIAAKAMKMGIAVYCQKPLTRTIWEARKLGEIAKKSGVVTQMGNQGTALNVMRKAAYQIRAGQLGNVTEVHVWTNRPVWPQGEARGPEKAVPAHIDWDAWIGSAQMRPFADGYHPFKWRGWWDFGSGALGDMACHTCNLPHMGLNLKNPTSVEAETSGHNGDSYPAKSKIKFEFPKLGDREAFTFHWYDGSYLPDPSIMSGFKAKVGIAGCAILGDKGKMFAAGDYAQAGIEIVGSEPMEVDYPKLPGNGSFSAKHYDEFFSAVKGVTKGTTGNFPDYAGPLTETILLGNLAVYKGGLVEWDAENLKVPNDPGLEEKIVKPNYRKGYEI